MLQSFAEFRNKHPRHLTSSCTNQHHVYWLHAHIHWNKRAAIVISLNCRSTRSPLHWNSMNEWMPICRSKVWLGCLSVGLGKKTRYYLNKWLWLLFSQSNAPLNLFMHIIASLNCWQELRPVEWMLLLVVGRANSQLPRSRQWLLLREGR